MAIAFAGCGFSILNCDRQRPSENSVSWNQIQSRTVFLHFFLDDRNERAGVKFKNADLIGIYGFPVK